MRVLLVPELYRRDATACGTLNDAVAWVEQWLSRDDHLHVYWLLPPRDRAGYDAEYVLADRDRVTLLEAETPAVPTGNGESVPTDCGYTPAQLEALEAQIFGAGAYVDVVVDQLRGGRFALYEWLLAVQDNHWAARVRPFDVVANVHDLQIPRKYRGCDHRNEFQMGIEIAGAVLADGIWFTAGVDREGLAEHAPELLDSELVETALEASVTVASPVAFDDHEESYGDAPEWLHVAGSFWEKKRGERALEIAHRLHERFGIRTVLTSMEPIPDRYARPSWVEARPEASRESYEEALRKGDLAVCASDYETMARTPFEQAASGQVLVARDVTWVDECVPDEYPLLGGPDELGDLAAWAVDNWDAAVAANRRLVEYARSVRAPGRVGERTYRDLRRRVEAKIETFAAPEIREIVECALAAGEVPVALDALVERTAAVSDDGRTLLAREDCTRIDVVYALRALGYVDDGTPGTPVFRPTDRAAAANRDG